MSPLTLPLPPLTQTLSPLTLPPHWGEEQGEGERMEEVPALTESPFPP
ncbi:protein of unknown function [Candidatus Bipolaricaulis anaerobius]|uniref:Uncharacterized protein n=1 Tax=Candidatus Bipolaricaulis anaerobius TaxID=2026885 RepID=A0A2X3K446_9BACT|nr:protein of unknown function [Candidatus Bipolaricaulis anaerobius]